MTPEREKKMRRVIELTQPDLTVIFENVHDPHNISAVLRTCDSVGIREIYILQTIDKPFYKLGKKSSSSASKWLDIKWYNEVDICIADVRKKYKRIFGTRLCHGAKDLYDLNLVEPVALVFGNEHSGISDKLAEQCDENFLIPQVGMIQSLNISVACAVTLYEAFRQRKQAGKYNSPVMVKQEREKLFEKWNLKT